MVPPRHKTAEMPLVPSRPHSIILDDLEDQSSLLIVPWRLPAIGERLRVESHRLQQQLSISIGQTVSNLQAAEANAMFTLVHAMSSSSIQSIIQGTVAYDTARGTTTWHDAPSSGARTPGVYVVALQSQPDGRFLSKKEILEVVDGIEDYITGCKVLRDKPAAASRNSTEKTKVRWVADVDAAYSARKWTFNAARPKFNRDADNLSGLRATADMLLRRCIDGVSDTVRQRQSPIYTGCSQNLSVRMGDYSLDRHLANVNKALGITLSVAKLKRLPLTPVVRVAIRTWRNDDLALAEQLVLSLADGFVTHRGFNKKEGGKNPPSNTPDEVRGAEKFAMVKSATFYTNVRASINETESRGRFLALLPKAAKHLEALRARATDLQAAVEQAQPELEQAGPVNIEQLQADLTALRDHKLDRLQRLKNQEKIGEALLAALGVGEASASQQEEVGEESSSSEQDEGIC
jgi:hypothetical protein